LEIVGIQPNHHNPTNQEQYFTFTNADELAKTTFHQSFVIPAGAGMTEQWTFRSLRLSATPSMLTDPQNHRFQDSNRNQHMPYTSSFSIESKIYIARQLTSAVCS
jgi:hypothetical protein